MTLLPGGPSAPFVTIRVSTAMPIGYSVTAAFPAGPMAGCDKTRSPDVTRSGPRLTPSRDAPQPGCSAACGVYCTHRDCSRGCVHCVNESPGVVGDGDGTGECDRVGLGVGVVGGGEGECDRVGLGDEDGEGEGVGDGEGDGDGDGDGEFEGVGAGVGVAECTGAGVCDGGGEAGSEGVGEPVGDVLGRGATGVAGTVGAPDGVEVPVAAAGVSMPAGARRLGDGGLADELRAGTVGDAVRLGLASAPAAGPWLV
jgi:hypothetical protein